jgi:hypothetical protein
MNLIFHMTYPDTPTIAQNLTLYDVPYVLFDFAT